MFKLIIFVLGLAIGFGGGVWWGVKHPEQAQSIAAEEERRVLQAQLAATRKAREQLDRIINNQKAEAPPPGSGFVAPSGGRGKGPDPETVALRDEQKKHEEELQRQLAALGAK